MTSFKTDAHSFPLFAFGIHLFIISSRKSFSTSSIIPVWYFEIGPHLSLGSLKTLASFMTSAQFLSSFSALVCHSMHLLLSISAIRSEVLHNSLSSLLVLILRAPYSVTGLRIFLKFLLYYEFNTILCSLTRGHFNMHTPQLTLTLFCKHT